jgi:hypothetical protein
MKSEESQAFWVLSISAESLNEELSWKCGRDGDTCIMCLIRAAEAKRGILLPELLAR